MDYDEKVVDMAWESKGCAFCRKMWETGAQPPRIGICFDRQAYLHRCDACGSYWEQDARKADTLSQEDAKRFYRKYFSEGDRMEEFLSLNQLESKLVAARQGRVPIGDFLQQLWSSEIALPTASEVQADGSGFEPILFDRQGISMLAAFTAKERIVQLGEIAKFCLMMKGADVLRRVPKGYGLVVNPGIKVGFEISPQGISEIIAEYG